MPRYINYKDTQVIVAADSRANHFGAHTYRQPHDLTITFIIKRGAKILDLVPALLDEVKRSSKKKKLIVKIAAGINNITRLIRFRRGKFITFDQVSHEQILGHLRDVRTFVHLERPDAVVGFVSIATASVKKFQKYYTEGRPNLNEQEITVEQTLIDKCIDKVNDGIRCMNREGQAGYSRGPRCVYWNTYIRSSSKRRNRNGKLVTSVRNSFQRLYDGLHPCPELKLIWFTGLCSVLKKEIESFAGHRH